ncbi:MAG: bifunctional folylpolyglutamate synthase/dihydrofolate synthase [Alphaproteobacteria bacterium]|nr:bifunctional folylpolyglutamate synthase/dihydrofolate synthase [Alphaproteobacteria bacterium]
MTIWRVPYPKFGAGPGLERCVAVATSLGVELDLFGARAAVVVGSNGKGSTAAMCASLLRQVDENVGLFTSPHLFSLNERFRVGEHDISDEELGAHWQRVTAAIDACGMAAAIGGFEFLFLIAADWFAARGCVSTVWEAGIGGRLDPVKLIQAQHVALTALDFEHTALLGDTLDAIAVEKVAAAPDGATLFVSEIAAPDGSRVREAIDDYCTAHKVHVCFVGSATHELPLVGEYQRRNAELALRLAKAIAPISDTQIADGFAATRWPGRLEVLSGDPLVVIDVGHTPDGVMRALEGFQAMRGDRAGVLVCGVSSDKEATAIIQRLAPSFQQIICAAARHKGAPPASVAVHAQNANPSAEITLAESVAEARRLALSKARGAAVYVAGGLFLAAEFKAVHLGRDPASLAFF